MKTAVYENYKPTDTLSTSDFMVDLLPDSISTSVQSG